VSTLIEGNGRAAAAGDRVTVHYVGWLADGGTTVFDSSWPRNQPYTVTLGQHRVIAGWEQGLVGVTPGERRQLVIGSDLGYGPQGYPPDIPPGASLVFVIDVVDVAAA
jgi:FKBP-type peptidyl-prolyl cis-trans isomerase